MNKIKLFKWGYRVKKWKVDFSIDYQVKVAPYTGDTATAHVEGVLIITATQTDEREMVCSVGGYTFTGYVAVTGSWSDTLGRSGTDFSAAIALDILDDLNATAYGIAGNHHYLRKSDDSYLPSINLTIFLDSSDAFWENPGTIGNGNAFFPLDTISGTMDGEALPMFLNSSNDAIAFSGTIAVTPYEFWPYNPDDGGGNIWDSASGAQLRDPLL